MGTDWYLVAAIIVIAGSFLLVAAICVHSARSIAAHEAGHAVFFWISPTSGGLESVSASVFSGLTKYVGTRFRPRRNDMLLEVMGSVSGYAGEILLRGSGMPSRTDGDLKRGIKDAEELLRRFPEIREQVAQAAAECSGPVLRARRVFDSAASPEVADLLTVLLSVCVRLLRRNLDRLQSTNAFLSRKRRLSGPQLRAVLGERPSRDEFWKMLWIEPL